MQIGIIVSLWLIFAFALWRALYRRKLVDAAARYIWLLFFLWMVAFSLWGETSEQFVNRQFGDQPLALYLKCACMLVTFHGYYVVLKPMHPDAHRYHVVNGLLPVSFVAGMVTLLLYQQGSIGSYAELRYLVIGGREVIMGLYALIIFIPYTDEMWRAETHPPLKLKQWAAMMSFICYSLSAVGGMTAGLLTLLHLTGAEAVVRMFNIAIYIGFIPFAMTLMPYRWLVGLVHLPRLVLYLRLRQLQRYIALHAGEDEPRLDFRDLWRTDGLELAIYRATIFILDYYPFIGKSSVYRQVRAVIRSTPESALLAQKLARIKRS